MQINEVKIADAEQIAELDMALFPDNCFNEQTLKKEISIGGGYTYYQAGKLIGYLVLRWDFENELMDIIRIGVQPSFQGLGVGRALLTAALTANASDAMLMAKKDNLRALRLYKKFGFEIVGQTTMSWVMVKLLTY